MLRAQPAVLSCVTSSTTPRPRPVMLDDEVKRAFAALADKYADVSARLFADDPHLSVDPLEEDL